MDYKISCIGDQDIKDVHHIGVDYNGSYYSVIFGKYVNGGFCCVSNFGAGCELSDFSDTFWNAESLGRVLKSKKAAKAIASAIAEFGVAQP